LKRSAPAFPAGHAALGIEHVDRVVADARYQQLQALVDAGRGNTVEAIGGA
jgi:hypothetical protein